jgi:hypothetical protein
MSKDHYYAQISKYENNIVLYAKCISMVQSYRIYKNYFSEFFCSSAFVMQQCSNIVISLNRFFLFSLISYHRKFKKNCLLLYLNKGFSRNYWIYLIENVLIKMKIVNRKCVDHTNHMRVIFLSKVDRQWKMYWSQWLYDTQI